MKKLVLTFALILTPVIAQAGFVEECKTANFNSDPIAIMFKAIQSNVPSNAKDSYTPICKCYEQKLSTVTYVSAESKAYVNSAFLFYIRRANMGNAMFIRGMDQRVLAFVEESYSDCQNVEIQKSKNEFVKQHKGEIDQCIIRVVSKGEELSSSEKTKILKETDYTRVNGKYSNGLSQDMKQKVSDGLRACD